MCTVWSWRRSRGRGSAACCGALEVRRCGNDQHGCDMADLKMYSFRRTKMIQVNHLEPQARIHIRACLCTDCMYVMHAVCICVHSPSNCRYCVPAIRNPTIQHALTGFFFYFKLIHCSSYCEECHHHDFHCQVESCHDVDDEDEVCGPPPSCLPINNVVIFFRSLKLLIRILTSLITCVDGCEERPFCCHEFVLWSLAFSFCFFVIWAKMSRWLFPFSIQSENPILRVCCIIMSLQSKSIVNNYFLLTNIVVLQ